MIQLNYTTLDDVHQRFSRILFNQYLCYEEQFTLSGSTWYMQDVLITVTEPDCTIDMSKLNYTINKWEILKYKYIDFAKWAEFKQRLRTSRSKSITFNFKVHNGEKDGCLVAMVLTRLNPSKPWTDCHVYYRVTEVFKKFAIDLILFNKIWHDLENANCNIQKLNLHIPILFFRIEFLAELIGSGYYNIWEFDKQNPPSEGIRYSWNRYYGPEAEIVKYHSIARKQKMKQRNVKLPALPIESLKFNEEEKNNEDLHESE